MPAARFGIREEMKQSYGFGWRDYVRGVTTTFDIGENLAFREQDRRQVGRSSTEAWPASIDPGFHARPGQGRRRRRRARTSSSSPPMPRARSSATTRPARQPPTSARCRARSTENGFYDPERESRQVASTGKMLLAIAIANQGRETADSLYSTRRRRRNGPRNLRQRRQPPRRARPSSRSPARSTLRS